MAYTLSQAALELAKLLGGVRIGLTTAIGSTSMLADNDNLGGPAEEWQNGTVWFLSGTYSGQFYRVTQFGNYQLTFDATLAGAVPAGVRFAVAPPTFPMNVLTMMLNRSLADLGGIVQMNDSGLTVAASTQVYTLPTGVKNVKKIEVATSASSPYDYKTQYYWDEVGGKIYFPSGKEPQTASMKFRIWYLSPHTELVNYNDVIDESVDLTWLIWGAAAHAYRDAITRVGKDTPKWVELMNEALQKEEELHVPAMDMIKKTMARTVRLANY